MKRALAIVALLVVCVATIVVATGAGTYSPASLPPGMEWDARHHPPAWWYAVSCRVVIFAVGCGIGWVLCYALDKLENRQRGTCHHAS